MTDSLDLQPPAELFVTHAPATAREAWRWLWRLDRRLERAVSDTSDVMMAQLRLSWWRDQFGDVGRPGERRDPMLVELDGLDDAKRETLTFSGTRLVDAVEAIAVNDVSLPTEAAGERGEALARGLAELIGSGQECAASIGYYWGLAQLAASAYQSAPAPTIWQSAVTKAADRARSVKSNRALSLMRMHAHMLVTAEGRPLGPKAGLRLTAHALTGF